MKILFENKHVLITGGSEGIGLALAHHFLGDGASTTLLARNLDKLQDAKSVLKAAHPERTVNLISADVSNAKQVTEAIRRVEDEFGVVDVAVCNAGLAIPKLIVDQTLEEAELIMQVNYMGCYYTAHALLPGMIARGAGHICFISSMIYVSPMAGYSAYGPTKAAVRHLADCLRSELCGTGVTVSVGYPPDTRTPGFEAENQTKPGVIHAIMEHEREAVHSARAVAQCLFQGLQRGAYHLPTPSLLHRLGLSIVAGLTPRPLWLILEVLLAPVLVLVGWVTFAQQDAVVRKWRAAQLATDQARPRRPPCMHAAAPAPPRERAQGHPRRRSTHAHPWRHA